MAFMSATQKDDEYGATQHPFSHSYLLDDYRNILLAGLVGGLIQAATVYDTAVEGVFSKVASRKQISPNHSGGLYGRVEVCFVD